MCHRLPPSIRLVALPIVEDNGRRSERRSIYRTLWTQPRGVAPLLYAGLCPGPPLKRHVEAATPNSARRRKRPRTSHQVVGALATILSRAASLARVAAHCAEGKALTSEGVRVRRLR